MTMDDSDGLPKLQLLAGLYVEDQALLRELNHGLTAVNAQLRETAHSSNAPINEAAQYLIAAGGKRFRPVFTFLAAQFGKGITPEVITAAVVIELTHLATLYHDDVMDEATMRRGVPSVNARWNNAIAILVGDFLLTKAFRLMSELDSQASLIAADVVGELITGQLRETMGPEPADDPISHYLSVIKQKTGVLIALSARFGGLFSDTSPEHIEALHKFGELTGVAFQISDDILDISSPSEELGKKQGTDLREGIHTLPMLYALADPDVNPRLKALLAAPLTDNDDVAEALSLLRSSPGLQRARQTLTDYADRARAELSVLPDVPARSACMSMVDYLLARTH